MYIDSLSCFIIDVITGLLVKDVVEFNMKSITVSIYRFCKLLSFVVLFSACSEPVKYEEGADAQGHTAATPATIKVNKRKVMSIEISITKSFHDKVL